MLNQNENVEWKWRRLSSNGVISRFFPSIEDVWLTSSVKCCRRLTSFDSMRQTLRFSTNFVEAVENWQFLTIFDDFRRFWKFLKFSKNSSTIFDKNGLYSTFKRPRLPSIVVKWRPFTSFYVDRRQSSSNDVDKRHFTSIIDKYYRIPSIFVIVSRFHLKTQMSCIPFKK